MDSDDDKNTKANHSDFISWVGSGIFVLVAMKETFSLTNRN